MPNSNLFKDYKQNTNTVTDSFGAQAQIYQGNNWLNKKDIFGSGAGSNLGSIVGVVDQGIDTTLNLVGKQRLPNTKSNPAEFQLADYSPSYAILNAQISRNFSEKIRVYLGGENLTGYQQKVVILDSANPFGNYFDGGIVYAPIMKQNFYVGVDFKF